MKPTLQYEDNIPILGAERVTRFITQSNLRPGTKFLAGELGGAITPGRTPSAGAEAARHAALSSNRRKAKIAETFRLGQSGRNLAAPAIVRR